MGTAILRRYVLISAIGRGGVSTVYSAVDAVHGRLRAIKVFAPVNPGDRRARAAVRREAMITDRVRHPGVPRVFACGDAPLPDGTVVPYVVLELLRGAPLAHRLAAGRLAWSEAVRIAATAADVLAVAHRAGVVHRDLSAHNVLVTKTDVKLVDFGLATLTPPAPTPAPSTLASPALVPSTLAHAGAGRPRWPVSAFARPTDDVYTLGVLLYEMLTGRSPYPAATAATIRAAGRVTRLAPTPVLAVPGLPRGIADIVRACMAKAPAGRPGSADAARALWDVLDRNGRRTCA